MIEKFSITKYAHWCWKGFCLVFLNRQKLKRDAIILSAVTVFLIILPWINRIDFAKPYAYSKSVAVYVGSNWAKFDLLAVLNRMSGKIAGESADQAGLSEEQVQEEVKVAQESIDTGNWKIYQSRWYGVELKYPDGWNSPVHKSAGRGTNWEYRSQFRKKDIDADNPYVGFDLVIYSTLKIKEATNADEFPKLKSEELKDNEACATIQGHLIETGDYPAEEIYIPPADDCYAPVLYFSFVRDNYVYNIIPVAREGYESASDPMVDAMDHFPEFFSVASETKITDIVRPKPKPAAAPRATGAPMPYIYKNSNGRRVCASKNDNPSKSKKNKGRHMDMECCLDPDEIPNPNCYYDPKKYGKYL